MKSILVGIDFKQNSDLLIDKAIELAEKFNSKIWLLHAAAPEPDFVGYSAGPQTIRDARAHELKNENNTLSDYVNRIQDKGIDSIALLIAGPTYETILNEATKINADLIILGHHEHNLFYKVLFGDTAIEVIKKAKIPVMLVPC